MYLSVCFSDTCTMCPTPIEITKHSTHSMNMNIYAIECVQHHFFVCDKFQSKCASIFVHKRSSVCMASKIAYRFCPHCPARVAYSLPHSHNRPKRPHADFLECVPRMDSLL